MPGVNESSDVQWMREAWVLIATCREVEQEQWRIDGVLVTDRQVVELAVALGKEPLAKD